MVPERLPSQCEDATDVDPGTGEKIQSFGNWGPRVSVIYDLTGSGKTSVRASYSYYLRDENHPGEQPRRPGDQPALTWGNNQNSGACSATAGTPCWQDLNLDGVVQVNELIGNPTSGNSRFNQATGIFAPAGNTVDPSAKIGRTSEFITGIQHELMPNFAVGAEYVYRKYDRGTAAYSLGYEPGAAGLPVLADLHGPADLDRPGDGAERAVLHGVPGLLPRDGPRGDHHDQSRIPGVQRV